MPKRLVSSVWRGSELLSPDPSVIYADDHQLVLEHPDWFADVVIIGARVDDAPVEQATAAPGERRRTTRR